MFFIRKIANQERINELVVLEYNLFGLKTY